MELPRYNDLISVLGADTSAATQHYGIPLFRIQKYRQFDGGVTLQVTDLISALGADTAATQHYVNSGFSESEIQTVLRVELPC